MYDFIFFETKCTVRIMIVDFKGLYTGDLSKRHLKVKKDTFSCNKDLKDKSTDNKASSVIMKASDQWRCH